MHSGLDGGASEHAGEPGRGVGYVFTPDSSRISKRYMGLIPAAVLQRPGRVRGNHPGGSFTALGLWQNP